MQENKKKMISLGLTTVALLLIVVGATYAYFAAQIDNGASTDVNITAESVDSLTFTTGDPISFSITQENLKQGGTDRGGSTTATASLIAGKDSSASYNYYVYLNIANNEFEYTTEDKKPELILKVTGPNNTEVTAIDGLTYNSTLKGFDITSVDGLIKIAENYNIATPNSETQSWNIEIIFKNLESNQSDNAGKRFKGEVRIQSKKMADTLADLCSNGDNFASCIKDMADKNTYNSSRLLHHDASLEYGANDDSYRFTGPDYILTIEYMNDYDRAIDAIGQVCNGVERNAYYKCNRGTQYYYLRTDEAKTQYATYKEALTQAFTQKIVKPIINNFVCFGTDATDCPKENLYRIMGIFKDENGKYQAKLIKYDYATQAQLGYSDDYTYEVTATDDTSFQHYTGYLNSVPTFTWNIDGTNDWKDSTIYNNLNTTYLNSLGTWQNKIATSKWSTNKITFENNYNTTNYVKRFHDEEIAFSSYVTNKIGLMYTSDYSYAFPPKYWGNTLLYQMGQYAGSSKENWMYMGLMEGTMVGAETGTDDYMIFALTSYITNSYSQSEFAYRPTFYLLSNVTYKSGTGTEENPYRINQ